MRREHRFFCEPCVEMPPIESTCARVAYGRPVELAGCVFLRRADYRVPQLSNGPESDLVPVVKSSGSRELSAPDDRSERALEVFYVDVVVGLEYARVTS